MPVHDVDFTAFAFKASGASTARTMPERLAEVKNVVDFGADPTGGNASATTAAIQAAVDWTAGANRGTIYFPLGAYQTSGPITFNYDGNLSICFRGEIGSTIFGNFAGYIFDRHLTTPNNTTGGRMFEKLNIQNGHAAGGCIRLGSTIGGAIRDCGLGGATCITTEDSAGQSSESIHIENCSFGASTGIIIGGGGAIQGCNIPGATVGVRAYGGGLHISGCRAERCGTSFLFGLDSADNPVGAQGFSIVSTSTEGCWTAIDLGGDTGGLCEGFVITSFGHFGHPADGAGPTPDIQESQYGIRVREDCARGGLIQSVNLTGPYGQAGFAIESAATRSDLVIRENYSVNTGGAGSNWSFPSNAYTARFLSNNEMPTWTYSQLPSGGNVLEGDEFNITDSNTAIWGATAAGSGTNHVLVRWNGSIWTVVGK